MLWLGFIKTRNLGQKPFIDSPIEQDTVPMKTERQSRPRLLIAKQMEQLQINERQAVSASGNSVPDQNGMETATKEGNEDEDETRAGMEGSEESGGTLKNSTEGTGAPTNPGAEPTPPVEMYGSYIDPVPVVIVGSHYDKLEGESAAEAVRQTQELVDELRGQFEENLTISPRLYPLNCLSPVSKEIKDLKERLCEVRSELVEVRLFLW